MIDTVNDINHWKRLAKDRYDTASNNLLRARKAEYALGDANKQIDALAGIIQSILGDECVSFSNEERARELLTEIYDE